MDIFKKNRLLIIILITAFLIRLFYIIFLAPNRLDIPSGDAIGYDTLGWNLVQYHQLAFEKDRLSAHREPGYPVFLAGIYYFVGHNVFVARVIQSFISVLSILLVFIIAVRLFNARIGYISSLICAVYPAFIYYSATLLREIFFIFLLLCCICCLTYFFNRENSKLQDLITGMITGIIFALASLTNSIVLLLFAAVLIAGIFLKKKISVITVLLLSFVIVYSPWIIRNYKVFGAFISGSTNGGKTFWDGTDKIPFETRGLPEGEQLAAANPDINAANQLVSEPERDKFFYKQAFEYIKINKKYYCYLTIQKFIKLWRFFPHSGRTYGHSNKFIVLVSVLSYAPVFLLSILSLFFIDWKRSLPLLIPLFLIPLAYSFFWSQARYRLPLESILIILAAYSIVLINDKYLKLVKS